MSFNDLINYSITQKFCKQMSCEVLVRQELAKRYLDKSLLV